MEINAFINTYKSHFEGNGFGRSGADSNGTCIYLDYSNGQFSARTLNIFERLLRYLLPSLKNYKTTHLSTLKQGFIEHWNKITPENLGGARLLASKLDALWEKRYPKIQTQKLTDLRLQAKTCEPPKSLPNLGNTCYLAAAFQVLQNTKEVKDAIFRTPITRLNPTEKERLQEIKNHIDWEITAFSNPTDADLQQKHLKNRLFKELTKREPNMRSLCYALYPFMGKTPRDIPEQEDCTLPLSLILKQVHYPLQITEKKFQNDQLTSTHDKNETLITLHSTSNSRTLPSMLKDYLHSVWIDENQTERKQEISFKTLPKDLFFSIQKNSSQTISDYDSVSILDKEYELKSYILHHGEAENGHYVSVVKDQDGECWLCNDSRIEAVSKDSFNQGAQHAYVLHYSVL